MAGEIDLHTAPTVLDELLGHAQQLLPEADLHIDCADLTFIDSAVLSMLTAVADETGRTIVLERLRDNCRRTVELTGLDRVVTLVD